MSLINPHILLDQQSQQLGHQDLLSICELIIIQDKRIDCSDEMDAVCKMMHDMIQIEKEMNVKLINTV